MRFCDIRCTIHVVRWIVHWNLTPILEKTKLNFNYAGVEYIEQ